MRYEPYKAGDFPKYVHFNEKVKCEIKKAKSPTYGALDHQLKRKALRHLESY